MVTKNELVQNLAMSLEIVELGMEIETLLISGSTEESIKRYLETVEKRHALIEQLQQELHEQFPNDFEEYYANFKKEKNEDTVH